MSGVKLIETTYIALHTRLPDDQSKPHDDYRQLHPLTFPILTFFEMSCREVSEVKASA